ncbi:MAG: zinc ribbon domain-containing protein [Clostridiales bacterium]|nr:zinc ribbon domain-containing protein [Clostridiales bacterium]
MRELKQALRNLVNGQQFLSSILPAAAVLVLIDPVLVLIDPVLVLIDPVLVLIHSISYQSFYNQTAGLFFVVYLVGLILCLAADIDWAIGLAFALKAVANLFSFANYATFSKLVYVAFYGVLAFFFLRAFFQSEQGQKVWNSVSGGARSGSYNRSYTGGSATGGTVVCGNCGLTVQGGGGFCPRCGRKLEPGARFCAYCGPEAGPIDGPGTGASGGYGGGSSSYSGASHGYGGGTAYRSAPTPGTLAGFCSGGIFLIFTVVLTLKLVCSVVLQFNLLTVIASIPSIVLCVGLWEVWSDSNKGQLRSNGFRLASGALLAELIIACIPLVLVVLASFLVMSAGDEAVAIGLLLLVGVVIAFLLLRLYWLGLRKTAQSAAAVAEGYGDRVEATLFPIVMLFITGIMALVSLASLSSISSILSNVIGGLQSYLGMYSSFYGIDSSLINSLLGSLYPDWKTYVVQLLTAASPICAALMLISVRSTWSDRR